MDTLTLYEELQKEAIELLEKAYAIRINNLDASVDLTNRAIVIGQQINKPDLVARARNQLGLFYMILGRFQEALLISEEALAFFEKTQSIKGIADAKYTIAGVHYKTDNFHLGLQYLLDCLNIYRKLSDHHNESRVLKSMGTIYEYFGDQQNAIDSYVRSIEASQRAKDLNLESNAYNPLSGIYLKQGLVDLALATIEKSISIKEQTKDLRGLAFALYGRGKVYTHLKKYQEAKTDLSKCLELQTQMGDQLGVAMAYNKLGQLYFEMKEYASAKAYSISALQVANQHNIRYIKFKIMYRLHLLARCEGNDSEALDFLEKYITIKESIINSHTHNVIKSYEAISKVNALEREAELQRSKTEIIEKKNAELDSFFYRVSHDLKGPISSLLGLHNLVKLEIKEPKAQGYFEMYQSQIMRINTIVIDLINLTRMNHADIHPVKINFESLLNECIQAYQYLDNFKFIRFIKTIDDSINFHSEWAIINTILQNLIENSIKYAAIDRDPFVKISVSQCDKHVKILVEDNGVGIDPLYQQKVFNMFFRANDRVEGTGLGLYILKRAVERLHGQVSFESKVHIGSTFTVLLPAIQYTSSNDLVNW